MKMKSLTLYRQVMPPVRMLRAPWMTPRTKVRHQHPDFVKMKGSSAMSLHMLGIWKHFTGEVRKEWVASLRLKEQAMSSSVPLLVFRQFSCSLIKPYLLLEKQFQRGAKRQGACEKPLWEGGFRLSRALGRYPGLLICSLAATSHHSDVDDPVVKEPPKYWHTFLAFWIHWPATTLRPLIVKGNNIDPFASAGQRQQRCGSSVLLIYQTPNTLNQIYKVIWFNISVYLEVYFPHEFLDCTYENNVM